MSNEKFNTTEMSTLTIRQTRGDRQRGLALLDQLDAHFAPN
jgi:hypothetical protein